MKLERTLVLVLSAAALFGCNKQEGVGKTTTTGATEPFRYLTATAHIADARCDREVTCNQVGADKRFETREICASEEGKRTKDELKSADCPNGVDSKKLQTCLAALGKQDCSQLATSLQTVQDCRAAALCLP